MTKGSNGASSSSSSSSGIANRRVCVESSHRLPCGCGLPAKILTSRTPQNPGKRFVICPVGACGLWEWAVEFEMAGIREEISSLKKKVEEEMKCMRGEMETMKKELDELKKKQFNLKFVLVVFFLLYVSILFK